MVGVDRNRKGGMWTVANTFINDSTYNKSVKLYYVVTSTGGSVIRRIAKMIIGYSRIFTILLFKHIDIVHIHMAEKGSVFRKGLVIFVSKLFNKRIIVQMHAGPIMDWYKKIPKWKKVFVSTILNAPDMVIVLGSYWKSELSAIVPEEKLTVIYNGTDCSETNPYNEDGNLVLFVGHVSKEKGIFDLLNALQSINSKLNPAIEIVLCGTDRTKGIEGEIKKRSLSNRVRMKGWISKRELQDLYKRTVMCVLPTYFEALSMTVIESMSQGIPIITTDISTMTELLGDEIEKFVPGDVAKLSMLILDWSSNRAKLRRISDIEHERAYKLFSTKKNISDMLTLYSQLLKEKSI